MSDQSWPATNLGELFTINTDGVAPNTSPSTEFYHHSLPAWDELRGPAVEKGSSIESNKTKMTKPCVLVSKLNPRKPRVSVVERVPNKEHHCASTEFVCLEPKSEEPLNFWGHLFSNKRFSENLDRIAIGSTNSHKRYSPKALLSQRIELPPVPERRLIAHILDTLDTQIRKTEALIAKLEKVKEGLLHDLLTRGIYENGQLRPGPEQAPELYKESPLGLIPREWEISSAGVEFEITSGVTLGAHRRPKKHPTPYLRVANVHRDRLMLNEITMLEMTPVELEEKSLIVDDLLIVEGHANPNEIGRCAKVTEEAVGLTFQNHLFRLRASGILAGFASLWMNSNLVRGYWRATCSTSSGLYTINRTQLGSVPVAKPSKFEQDFIISEDEKLQLRLKNETGQLAKMWLQKRGLMDDLLTGRVRVTPLLDQAQATTPA